MRLHFSNEKSFKNSIFSFSLHYPNNGLLTIEHFFLSMKLTTNRLTHA